MATDLRQTHFRFGKDDGTEAAHTFWQLEDVNHTQVITANWIFLLRFTEQESGGTAANNTDAVFQYNKNGAGWVDITTTSSVVKAVAVGAFTNGQACTKRLSGTGTFEASGAGCTEDGSSGGAPNDIAASGNSETEAGLEVVFADVVTGDVIQFRFRSPDWTITYTVTPTLTISITANVVVTPGTLALTLTMFAPSVIVGIVVVPGILALTLTTYAPTILISDNQTVTPGTLALILTMYAPTVIVSSGVIVTPGTLALILTMFAPVVISGYAWSVEALVENELVYIEALTGTTMDTRRDITGLTQPERTQAIADMKVYYPASDTYQQHNHYHNGVLSPCVLEAV